MTIAKGRVLVTGGGGVHRLPPVRASARRRLRRALRRQLLLVDQGQHRAPAAPSALRGSFLATSRSRSTSRSTRSPSPARRRPSTTSAIRCRPRTARAWIHQHAGPGQADEGKDPARQPRRNVRPIRWCTRRPRTTGATSTPSGRAPATARTAGREGALLRLPPPAQPGHQGGAPVSTPTVPHASARRTRRVPLHRECPGRRATDDLRRGPSRRAPSATSPISSTAWWR